MFSQHRPLAKRPAPIIHPDLLKEYGGSREKCYRPINIAGRFAASQIRSMLRRGQGALVSFDREPSEPAQPVICDGNADMEDSPLSRQLKEFYERLLGSGPRNPPAAPLVEAFSSPLDTASESEYGSSPTMLTHEHQFDSRSQSQQLATFYTGLIGEGPWSQVHGSKDS